MRDLIYALVYFGVALAAFKISLDLSFGQASGVTLGCIAVNRFLHHTEVKRPRRKRENVVITEALGEESDG